MAEPLRVLIVSLHYTPEISGNAPYIASLAAALSSRGHRVSVISTHPHYPEWTIRAGYGGWTDDRRESNVRVRRLRHYVPTSPTNVRRMLAEASFGLRAAITRWPASDVVILPSPGLIASAIVMVRAWAQRVPTVAWVQDLYSLGLSETTGRSSTASRIIRRLEGSSLRRAGAVVAIHDRFARYVRRSFRVGIDRLNVIRNWTHLREVTALSARSAVRDKLGWGEETIVLHAGNQGVKQGLEHVVLAARHADSHRLPVRFVLLGQGNQNRRLRELGAGCKALSFLDPIQDDSEYQSVMRAADVLLVNEKPGVSEMSVPSKLTSYFTTGLPVLAATEAESVTAEEIAQAGAGITTPPDDPGALVAASMLLREDNQLARTLGAAGPMFVAQRLSPDAATAAFEEVLARTAESRPERNRSAT